MAPHGQPPVMGSAGLVAFMINPIENTIERLSEKIIALR
jgi:hypothetical protein